MQSFSRKLSGAGTTIERATLDWRYLCNEAFAVSVSRDQTIWGPGYFVSRHEAVRFGVASQAATINVGDCGVTNRYGLEI